MNTTNTRLSSVVIPKELGFILFVLAVVFILWPARVDAATFSVAPGTSEAAADSVCQLGEAITNINDGTRTNADCVEVGAYATNDTINLPAGTITGDGSGFTFNKAAKVVGQGVGVSIISNKDLYLYGGSSPSSEFTLQSFTMSGGGMVGVQETYRSVLKDMELESTDDFWIGLEVEGSGRVDVIDSYFHGQLNMTGSGLSDAIHVVANNSAEIEINIERTTINQVTHGIVLRYGGSGTGNINALIRNTTITGIGTPTTYSVGSGFDYGNSAAGIIAYGGGSGGSIGTVNYTTINNTYSSKVPNNNAAAIFEATDGDGQVSHTAQNDLYAMGNGSTSENYRRYSGSGSPTFTTTSNGGNVSSDSTLGTLLTKTTDKHSLTTLANFLGVLQNNGGAVPTLALLEGSPAINAGTSVGGLATDARGSARVLGASADAGAFESSFGVAGNNAVVPKVPNTGFGLLKNNPVAVLITTLISSAIIYITARKYKLLKK